MKKVSSLQISFVYILSIAAAGSYVLPNAVSKYSGKASYVVVALSVIVGLIYGALINYMVKKGGSVYDFFRDALGEKPADAVGILLSLWLLLLSAFSLRMFYERISTTVFAFIPKPLCMAILAILCALTLIYGSKIFGRTSETIFIIIAILLVIMTAFNIDSIEFTEFLPVNAGTNSSIIEAFVYPVSAFSYLTYYLYFHNSREIKVEYKKINYSIISAVFMMLFLVMMCIGTFGVNLAGKISYPIFTAMKNITVASDLDHFESIFTSAWIMVDYVFLNALLLSSKSGFIKVISKKNESEKKNIWVSLALCIIAFTAAICVDFSRFKLDYLNSSVFPYVNIFMGLFLPFVVFLLYLLRKKISN